MPKLYTNNEILQHALIGLEHRREEITAAIEQLHLTLKGSAPKRANGASSARRGRMSAAGRKRLALAMKRRWAKAKKAGKKRLG